MRCQMGACHITVTRFENVVVYCFVDQSDLARIHLKIFVDLGAQTVGVDDDRVRQADRALVVHTPVDPWPESERFRSRVRMHRLHVDHE